MAEYQSIALNEWLPAFAGKELPPYAGYKSTLNPVGQTRAGKDGEGRRGPFDSCDRLGAGWATIASDLPRSLSALTRRL